LIGDACCDDTAESLGLWTSNGKTSSADVLDNFLICVLTSFGSIYPIIPSARNPRRNARKADLARASLGGMDLPQDDSSTILDQSSRGHIECRVHHLCLVDRYHPRMSRRSALDSD